MTAVTPSPFSCTGAPASVTVAGFTRAGALNVLVLKIATGVTPWEPRLIVFWLLPGLMSMATAMAVGPKTNIPKAMGLLPGSEIVLTWLLAVLSTNRDAPVELAT